MMIIMNADDTENLIIIFFAANFKQGRLQFTLTWSFYLFLFLVCLESYSI